LHLPATYQDGDELPGIVVTGAWMTVKEQMPSRYARELAARGYAALAFDFRGWGESGSDLRQRENPAQKIEDILAAADFLRTHPAVGEVGGLGICASAGYMTHAATRTDALASVALVAPWLHDDAIVSAVYGGDEGVAALIDAGRAAEAAQAQTGTQTFVPAASTTDETAIMFGAPYYTEPERGQIPAWRNEVDPAFWEAWLTFDAQTSAPELTQPLLLVHSESAAIPQGAHQFYADAASTSKNQLWLNDVTQFDFYDEAASVQAASDAVAAHFARTLTAK
ncbi:MAG: alpha/beta hydrolase, partial [Bacteroidota bacterium]